MSPVCCRFIPISDLMLCYDFPERETFELILDDFKNTYQRSYGPIKEEDRQRNLSWQVIGFKNGETMMSLAFLLI